MWGEKAGQQRLEALQKSPLVHLKTADSNVLDRPVFVVVFL